MQRTALYEKHLAAGAKMIDFAGWTMPVQYEGILAEHIAVRGQAGLFDVSHMGQILVEGPDVLAGLQRLMTNDLARAKDGQAVYSLLCQPDGGILDDLLLYRLGSTRWLLVVNAARAASNEEWLRQHLPAGITVTNRTSQMALLAIQGPKAAAILQRLTSLDLTKIRFFRFAAQVPVAGVNTLLARTGYTGEDGFEIYFAAEDAPALWDELLAYGQADGLVPAGLGARDTLRLEAALPLYGQDLSVEVTPLEAGLGRFVDFTKGDFIGRAALLAQKEKGGLRQRAGLVMTGRGIPRTGYAVYKDGAKIGVVTSGTYAPTLQKNLGLALLADGFASPGDTVEVLIRNKHVEAELVGLPFYQRK